MPRGESDEAIWSSLSAFAADESFGRRSLGHPAKCPTYFYFCILKFSIAGCTVHQKPGYVYST